MVPNAEGLADFFRVRGIKFGRCLEPTMQCTEVALRAHSIQNRQTVDLLQENNTVQTGSDAEDDKDLMLFDSIFCALLESEIPRTFTPDGGRRVVQRDPRSRDAGRSANSNST